MKRKNKTSPLKNILKILPVLVTGVAVIYLGILVKDVDIPTVMPVNDVQVVGELNFLDRDKMVSMVKSKIHGGYFTVDLNTIRKTLMKEPWVSNVSLRRQWPGSLNVIIDEHEPVAYWNDDSYINASGEVFKPENIDAALNLPKLSGPDGHHNNVWKFMNVLYQKMALLDYEVARLKLDDRRAWQLVIAGQGNAETASSVDRAISVRLGRFDTEKRLQRFVRILPALTAEHGLATGKLIENNIKVIDMRYPNGFAVQKSEA